MMLKRFCLSVFVFLVSTQAVFAGESAITKDMVVAKHQEMQKLLSQRSLVRQAIKFLHNHIEEGAQFRVTVDNPTMTQASNAQMMTMGKTDYINSYIQGTNFIDGYEMKIKTLDFMFNEEDAAAYSREVITERGVMKDPMNFFQGRGRPFVSQTTCSTRHEMKSGVLVSTGSKCHTQVSYEEMI